TQWWSTGCYNQIRGMNPKPGAYTVIKGRILKLWRSQVIADKISVVLIFFLLSQYTPQVQDSYP
ncbi:MAG TPA: hypothetical protein GX520_05525, partial [Syntrophaceticus sp.]|nr:hypothetical protein [Syntrophaceticus sp.]